MTAPHGTPRIYQIASRDAPWLVGQNAHLMQCAHDGRIRHHTNPKRQRRIWGQDPSLAARVSVVHHRDLGVNRSRSHDSIHPFEERSMRTPFVDAAHDLAPRFPRCPIRRGAQLPIPRRRRARPPPAIRAQPFLLTHRKNPAGGSIHRLRRKQRRRASCHERTLRSPGRGPIGRRLHCTQGPSGVDPKPSPRWGRFLFTQPERLPTLGREIPPRRRFRFFFRIPRNDPRRHAISKAKGVRDRYAGRVDDRKGLNDDANPHSPRPSPD